jgi:hypothetical protein
MTLVEGVCDWGKSLWLKTSRTGRAGSPLIFNYTLEFALQFRKNAENLGQVCRLALNTSHCVDVVALLGAASSGLLSVRRLCYSWVTSDSPWLVQVPSELPN